MPRNCLKSDTVAGLISTGAFSADEADSGVTSSIWLLESDLSGSLARILLRERVRRAHIENVRTNPLARQASGPAR